MSAGVFSSEQFLRASTLKLICIFMLFTGFCALFSPLLLVPYELVRAAGVTSSTVALV